MAKKKTEEILNKIKFNNFYIISELNNNYCFINKEY
jgi:hypothetical protein